MRYGLPYQGSKSRIAKWVVDTLPKSHTLVDLFAGGCAVTHAALLSGKWEHFIINDITDTPAVFVDAIKGEFKNFSTVLTRDEFMKCDDTALQLLYSFGNSKKAYLWAEDIEQVKVSAAKMLCSPSLHERRIAYRAFVRNLLDYISNGDTYSMRIQSIERLDGLQNLEALERLDYRLVEIPEGATVYADPPYRGTNCDAYEPFDFDAFDAWLNGVDFPVFVSEYTCPKGCFEVARIGTTTHYSQTNNDKRIERIFVQERFKDEIQLPTLFGAEDFE